MLVRKHHNAFFLSAVYQSKAVLSQLIWILLIVSTVFVHSNLPLWLKCDSEFSSQSIYAFQRFDENQESAPQGVRAITCDIWRSEHSNLNMDKASRYILWFSWIYNGEGSCEPPPKRCWTDEQGQPSSSFPLDSSSIPIADSPSPSTSEVATDPDGQSAPEEERSRSWDRRRISWSSTRQHCCPMLRLSRTRVQYGGFWYVRWRHSVRIFDAVMNLHTQILILKIQGMQQHYISLPMAILDSCKKPRITIPRTYHYWKARASSHLMDHIRNISRRPANRRRSVSVHFRVRMDIYNMLITRSQHAQIWMPIMRRTSGNFVDVAFPESLL